jgi:putative FmdB family regulatory protein
MPIYAYKCSSCGHTKDELQKISAAPLTHCPACGSATFAKQLTAPGFQLKGSGWYVTDFRDGKKPAGDAKKEGENAEAKPEGKTEEKAVTGADTKADTKTPTPAPATAAPPSPAATPATAPPAPAAAAPAK